jgi:cytochrome c2
MPEMFPADEAGRVERYAVMRYLVSLGGPMKTNRHPPDRREWEASAARGERLFNSIGCTACHGEKRQDDAANSFVFTSPARGYPLTGLADKTTPERLAEYLKNPLAIDPSGRMPHMLLHDREERKYRQGTAHSACDRADVGRFPTRG